MLRIWFHFGVIAGLILILVSAGSATAANISSVLNDGQGDFDPWNQSRWASWYTDGKVSTPFDIDCSVTFASRATPWEPELTGEASQKLFRVSGYQGIVIDGNEVVIDAQKEQHTLNWIYSLFGGQIFWNNVVAGDRGILFSQSYSAANPTTIIRNITLKGFTQALRTSSSQKHPLLIENCDFARNNWGLYFSGSKSTVTDCNIYENAQGGIYNGSSSNNNSILNSTWRDNSILQQWGRIIEKSYADIVLDTSYGNLVEGNVHQPPDQGFHAALSMYRNMGESGNLREDCPHDNIIRENTINGYSIGYNIGARMGSDYKNDVSEEGRDYANYNTFYANTIENTDIGIKLNTPGNTIEGNSFSNVSHPIVLHAVFYHLIETTINDQAGDAVSFWSKESDYSSYSSWFPFQDDRNGSIAESEKVFHVCSKYGAPSLGSAGSAVLITEDDLIIGNDAYLGDFEFNRNVNLIDLGLFAQYWLEDGCAPPDWCGGAERFIIDGTVDENDLAEFSGYWLTGIPMKDVYSAGGTPIDIACCDFYNNSPGDELAVLWDQPISNISGNNYYSIVIYDKSGIEINRCGRSSKKWKTIAAGDFLSEKGHEIAVTPAEAVDGKYPVYIFRRGYESPHAVILAENTIEIKSMAAGNFYQSDNYDEIAIVFETGSTNITYVKPNSGWSSSTISVPAALRDITAGNFDGLYGDEVAGVTDSPSSIVYYFKPSTSGAFTTSGSSGGSNWTAVSGGNFDGNSNSDQTAVAGQVYDGICEISYFQPGSPSAFKKADEKALGVEIASMTAGYFYLDERSQSYQRIRGFQPTEDYSSQIDSWGKHTIVLPILPQTTAIPAFWITSDSTGNKSHLAVTPLFK